MSHLDLPASALTTGGLLARAAHQCCAQAVEGASYPPGAQIGDGGHRREGNRLRGEALDVAQQVPLARLDQGDGDAGPAGATDAADAVHVGFRRRGYVVVDHVAELIEVEPACRDVSGHQQHGAAGAHASHDAVALLLAHAAVQRFGLVAAPAQRLG